MPTIPPRRVLEEITRELRDRQQGKRTGDDAVHRLCIGCSREVENCERLPACREARP